MTACSRASPRGQPRLVLHLCRIVSVDTGPRDQPRNISVVLETVSDRQKHLTRVFLHHILQAQHSCGMQRPPSNGHWQRTSSHGPPADPRSRNTDGRPVHAERLNKMAISNVHSGPDIAYRANMTSPWPQVSGWRAAEAQPRGRGELQESPRRLQSSPHDTRLAGPVTRDTNGSRGQRTERHAERGNSRERMGTREMMLQPRRHVMDERERVISPRSDAGRTWQDSTVHACMHACGVCVCVCVCVCVYQTALLKTRSLGVVQCPDF